MRTRLMILPAILICIWASGALAADNNRSQQIKSLNPSELDASIWRSYEDTPQLYEAICKRPANREYADLCQQWRNANYAEKQLYWSEKQAAFALLSLIGLCITSVVTAWAAYAASKASRAAAEANESMIRSEQPHLFFHRIKKVLSNSSLFFQIKNHGRSSAVLQKIQAMGFIADTLPTTPDYGPENLMLHTAPIAPGEDFTWPTEIQPHLTTDQVRQIEAGEITLRYNFAVYYGDNFRSNRINRSTWRYVSQTKRWEADHSNPKYWEII